MNDDELRTRFSQLREHDAAQAPDFAAMHRRVMSRARTDRPMLASLRYAAAAVFVIGVGLLIHQLRTAIETSRADDRVPAIGSWESPTTSLLGGPGRELMDPPPLLSSVLDGVSSATLSRKGD